MTALITINCPSEYRNFTGDEIIVPTHTWISTAEAVSNIGAIPV